MKKKRNIFLLSTTSLVLLWIVLELIGRVALTVVMKYPFWKPTDKFYPELLKIQKEHISQQDDTFDLLILGGSAVSLEFGLPINKTLDSLLKQTANGRKVRIFNAAIPAHTSLDNLNKYRMLGKPRFDLVIYYEAINETRANNIPSQLFSDDYRHIMWYYDLAIIKQHPEVNWTVLPFITHKGFNLLIDKLKGKKFLELNTVNPDLVQYGKEIKTGKPYQTNIEQIILEARKRSEKLVLMTYALYVPPSVIGNGGYTDYRDFAKCPYPSPLWLWGDPVNVDTGVKAHNAILRKLAAQYGTYFVDMDQLLPRQKDYYCDLCHLTEKGGSEFAILVVQNLFKEQLIPKTEKQ